MKSSFSLYWGEIHIHTQLSDGRGSPRQNLRYARDRVDLDFAAVTDHAEDLTEERWNITKESVKEMNQAGDFVTILGFEWTQPSGKKVWTPLLEEKISPENLDTPRFGHRNIYYKKNKGEYFAWNDEKSNTPEKLWKRLKEQRQQALSIPHHPASYVFPVDWDYHNPEFERLVEIYSMWGNSEHHRSEGNSRPILRGGGEIEVRKKSHVRHALNHGAKVGIIAGSDGHDGHGGRTRHHIQNLTEHEGPFYPSGVTGVLAEDLSRESIWNSLWDRRCYGTTGAKIDLTFEINDNIMGSEIENMKETETELLVEINGTADVKEIQLIENGREKKHFYGKSPRVKINEEIEIPRKRPLYYYVKAHQTDGEIAWSSPIWLD